MPAILHGLFTLCKTCEDFRKAQLATLIAIIILSSNKKPLSALFSLQNAVQALLDFSCLLLLEHLWEVFLVLAYLVAVNFCDLSMPLSKCFNLLSHLLKNPLAPVVKLFYLLVHRVEYLLLDLWYALKINTARVTILN